MLQRSKPGLIVRVLCAAIFLTMLGGQEAEGYVGELPLEMIVEGSSRSLNWLTGQLVEFKHDSLYDASGIKHRIGAPSSSSLAVASYRFESGDKSSRASLFGQYKRAYVYDNAAAAIAFTQHGRYVEARAILSTLAQLTRLDPSLGFSFNTSGDNFYDKTHQKSGTIAWAGYAMAHYQLATGDTTFQDPAEAIAAVLLARQVADPLDDRDGLITGGISRSGKVVAWAAAEHQFDAWFFLSALSEATGNATVAHSAEILKKGILRGLWDDVEGRFFTAVHVDGVNQGSMALDAQSWGAVFLSTIGEKEKAVRALTFAERKFRSADRGVSGYKPYAGYFSDYRGVDWDEVDMVWGEGTLGMALAYERIGESAKAREILGEMLKLQSEDRHGGLIYSTTRRDDFLNRSSAASTAWLALVTAEFDASPKVQFWG